MKCLSNKTLTEDQINLLAKALKFIQINTVTKHNQIWWQFLWLWTVSKNAPPINAILRRKGPTSFPYQIKTQPTSVTNENKRCKHNEGGTWWKFCREQTTLIIVKLIANWWAWELVPSKVGGGPVQIPGTAGRFHVNPVSGNQPCKPPPTGTVTLKELQWRNLPDLIPTMNHFLICLLYTSDAADE